MIHLPKEYKESVINSYGDKGKEWLENFNLTLNRCIKEFELDEIELVDKLSINIVLFAKSRKYGDIVLKILHPSETSINEIRVMKKYPKKYIPKLYLTDEENKIIIMERLYPGNTLDQISSRIERIKIFYSMLNHIKLEINSVDLIKERTIIERIKHSIEYTYKNQDNYKDIMDMIEDSSKLCKKMEKTNLPKYILHDDLQHKNILKSKEGWKVIDPHGIIGERFFDTAMFIKAELSRKDTSMENMEEIVSLVAKYCKEDKENILKALFVFSVEKVIWGRKVKYCKEEIQIFYDICIYLEQKYEKLLKER